MKQKIEIDAATVLDAIQFLAALFDASPSAVARVEARLDCGPDFLIDLLARLRAALEENK